MAGGLIETGPWAGWCHWHAHPGEGFAGLLGDIMWRQEADGTARLGIDTDARHANVMGALHGGFLMAFVDFALFAVLRQEMPAGQRAVTVQCATDFLDAGEVGLPLEARGRLLRQTGKMAFTDGMLWQGDRAIARWNGILRKLPLRA